MLVLGINTSDLSRFPFHGFQASTEYTIRCTVLSFNLNLTITVLIRFMLINKNKFLSV